MIIQMNFAIGISYESEIFFKSSPIGVIGDRSIHFTQLEDTYNYSDGFIDYNIILTNVVMMIIVHVATMYVINANDKHLNIVEKITKL